MNHPCSLIALSLLVAAVSSSGHGDKTAALPRGVIAPPGDALHLCGGHVTGAPLPDGKPGSHIVWEAYSSQELPEALAKRYLDSLGSEAHSRSDDGCDLWRFPADKPTHTLKVCPVSSQGPWSECSQAPPRTAKSIILISSMAQGISFTRDGAPALA